jgi:hypothetical protein
MLRGLARQLTSLSAFAEARLAAGVAHVGTARDCLAPAWCAGARHFSTNQGFKVAVRLWKELGCPPAHIIVESCMQEVRPDPHSACLHAAERALQQAPRAAGLH